MACCKENIKKEIEATLADGILPRASNNRVPLAVSTDMGWQKKGLCGRTILTQAITVPLDVGRKEFWTIWLKLKFAQSAKWPKEDVLHRTNTNVFAITLVLPRPWNLFRHVKWL